jgi:delta-aminolevulinic acid dehydratase/porphobilinogen synthase
MHDVFLSSRLIPLYRGLPRNKTERIDAIAAKSRPSRVAPAPMLDGMIETIRDALHKKTRATDRLWYS